MIADLDTLLTALYVELTDRIIPSLGFTRSGPGQRPEVTDAELVCLAVAQVLLRFDDEWRWLRAAAPAGRTPMPPAAGPGRVPPPGQAGRAADGGRAAVVRRSQARDGGDAVPDGRHPRPVRALGHHCPPLVAVRLGGLRILSRPFPLGLGIEAAADVRLRRDGDRFCLASLKLAGEREQARQMLQHQPANRPAPGTAVVTGKGLSGYGRGGAVPGARAWATAAGATTDASTGQAPGRSAGSPGARGCDGPAVKLSPAVLPGWRPCYLPRPPQARERATCCYLPPGLR